MKLIPLLLLVLTNLLHTALSASDCSALQSYVQVTITTSTGTTSQTVTSAHALFEPHSYYIPETELVQLGISEDGCDEDSISADLTGKIILLFSNDDCSDHRQVLSAQYKNASAVLMTSKDSTVDVVIVDDGLGLDATDIPMRTIALDLGTQLAANLTDGDTVLVEFGCTGNQYPTELCLIDMDGSNWWLDGDYTLQFEENGELVTKNNHPVWKKEGYTFFTYDEYLYLDTNGGQDNWFWAITEDSKMRNQRLILARCTDNNIDVPTDCQNWNTTQWNFYGIPDDYAQLLQDNEIQLTSGLCAIPDSYICIQSEQSFLAGLEGTYRLYHKNVPYWFREWDDCDNTPGWFVGFYGYFYLVDPFDGWIIAYCEMVDNWNNVTMYQPNLCDDWYTIVDGSLDIFNLKNDSTMTVTQDVCSNSYPCIDTEPPNTLCLSKNSIAHSFLEGDYIITGETGKKYGTKEYTRSELLYYEGYPVKVYLFYFGELSEKYDWWVLAAHNMSVGEQQNSSWVYGYLPCALENPTQCRANWNFFWVGSDDAAWADWHQDPTFVIEENACPFVSTEEVSYGSEYDYLCVDLDPANFEAKTFLESAEFEGGYKINRTNSTMMRRLSGQTPYWYKPANDYTDVETYVYYDEFFGYWQIGYGLHIETMLICMNSTRYPENCREWYDEYSVDLGEILSINVEDCDSNDYLVLKGGTGQINGWEVVGIVVGVLVLLAICLFIAYYLTEVRGGNKGQAEFVSPKDIPTKGKGKGSDNIELQNADGKPLTTGGIGPMDMSPLNPDDPIDDDTLDANGEPKNDNEDDGLIGGGTGNTAGNDDDDDDDSNHGDNVLPQNDSDDD